jgi:flagellar biosynthesis protein FlhB
MLEKTEGPSEAKLKNLREQGVVPISRFSGRCIGTIAYLAALWMMRSSAVEGFAKLKSVSDSAPLTPVLKEALAKLLPVFAGPLLISAIVVLLWGLFQTRFLFRFGLLSPDGARLMRFGAPDLSGILFRSLTGIAQGLCFLAAGALAARICWTGVMYLLNNDRLYLASWASSIAQVSLAPICIVLAVLAVAGFFSARFLFFMRHRMTRQELEREVVESEIAV